MTNNQAKPRQHEFKSEERVIRDILNKWNPIEGSPEDEYDCLVHHILSGLHRGAKAEGVRLIMTDELANHFGITVSEEELIPVAQDIGDWWQGRDRR
jgi:hypothetical protein